MSARVGSDVLPSGCGGCPTSALMLGRCVGLYPPIVPARWDDKSGLFTEIFFEICGNAFGTDATGCQAAVDVLAVRFCRQ